MPDLAFWDIVLRVGAAAVLGGAIGAEREIRERGAGFRTHMLVAVGAALFTLVSAYAWSDFHFSQSSGVTFDPTRIAAQIVSGIGFLGAGAIIRQGLSVRGLTTAATLWVVAAIGMASGAGYYAAAVVTTVVALVSLWPLRLVAHWTLGRLRPGAEHLVIELPAGGEVAPVLGAIEGQGASVQSFRVDDEGDRRELEVGVSLGAEVDRSSLVARLAQVEDVRGAQWSE